jgi:hypothetical protein
MTRGAGVIALLIANSLALASLLIMLASGRPDLQAARCVNFGHGAIYMLGAYLGYTVALVGGFWLALIVVPVLLALLGIAFEYLALRPRKTSHIQVALVAGPRYYPGTDHHLLLRRRCAQRRCAANPVRIGYGPEPVLSGLSHLPDRDGSRIVRAAGAMAQIHSLRVVCARSESGSIRRAHDGHQCRPA